MVAQEGDFPQSNEGEKSFQTTDYDKPLPWRQEIGVHFRVVRRIVMPDGASVFAGRVLISTGFNILAAPIMCAFPPSAIGVEIAANVVSGRLEAYARRSRS